MSVLDDIKKDPKQMAALLGFARRLHIQESILFYFDKGNEQALYSKYISESSASQVNIPSKVLTACSALAKTGDWGKMKPLLALAKAEVLKMLLAEPLKTGGTFYKSPEYKTWQTTNGPKVVDPKAARESAIKALKLLGFDPEAPQLKKYLELKTAGKDGEAAKELTSADAAITKAKKLKAAANGKKAAKILGIKDEKLLIKALEFMAVGNKAEAMKQLEALAKLEKMKEKAEMIYTSLVKSGLA